MLIIFLQRSPTKSMHASFFDMMVGGLPLAGESPLTAARSALSPHMTTWAVVSSPCWVVAGEV